MKFFEDILTRGLNLGEKYVSQEVLENGNQAPEIRPDTEQVPSKTVQPTAAQVLAKKAVIIGGSVFVGFLALAIIAKAVGK